MNTAIHQVRNNGRRTTSARPVCYPVRPQTEKELFSVGRSLWYRYTTSFGPCREVHHHHVQQLAHLVVNLLAMLNMPLIITSRIERGGLICLLKSIVRCFAIS